MDFTNPLPFRHQREPKPLLIPSAIDQGDHGQQGYSEPAHVEPVMELHPRSLSLPSASPRPRSPLPPHKLAKIANALGVSTPMPAFFRSPSPSGGSPGRTPSRYLLHVVPPAFLADDDDDGSDPDGTSSVSASGYRTQFRRGTLIPLYPTLQSQLGAIAREYNLPSTGGLVLYLVHSAQGGATDGPRISDDVWKLLWHKALQAERKDSQARTPSSLDFRSGRSTPSSPFVAAKRDHDPARTPSSPFPYPSPSTSSTPSSDLHLPLAHASPDLLADLTPNPFLPILAKVEFDIDRRKAGWFDAWAHGKRERSRWRAGPDGGRFELALPRRAQSRDRVRRDFSSHSEDSSEYAILDDGEGDRTAVDEDEQDQATVVLRPRDPLADVFGNDADAATWRELQAARQRTPKKAAGLGLSASQPELIIPPGDAAHDEFDDAHDPDDVVNLWNAHRRPTLPLAPPDARRRGPVPSPLVLAPASDPLSSAPATGNSVLPYLHTKSPLESDTSSGSEMTHERKARRRTGMVFGDLEVKVVAEPEEMSESELAAHRSSQVVMKHKLDQLEKQLAVLSPRHFGGLPPPLPGFDAETERPLRSAPPGADRFNITPPRRKTSNSISISPRKDAASTLKPASADPFYVPPRKESLAHVQPPRQREHRRGQGSHSSSGSSSKNLLEPPAARPKTQPPIPASPPPPTRLQERSPPQLTLKRASSARRDDADGDAQDLLLPAPPHAHARNPDSPVIPLSPDPFGKRPVEDLRHGKPPATEDPPPPHNTSRPPSRLQGTVLPAAVPEDAALDAQSSRFSADSEQGVEQLARQRRSIMSVRSLRNLWRKSNAGAGKLPPLPAQGELSPVAARAESAAQHGRAESVASTRSRRAGRPDSGADPFQFDNASIYSKAASPPPQNYAAAGGSIGQAKGILKGWSGHANPSDAEARRMRRSMSTTSVAQHAAGASLSVTPEPQLGTPHSLPLPATALGAAADDGTPRMAEFEIVSPPRRPAGLTPSVSYNGAISY